MLLRLTQVGRSDLSLLPYRHLTIEHIAVERVYQLRDKIRHHLNQAAKAEVIRNGIRLAIFGAPNAGKSSFLNWLGVFHQL